MRNCNYRNCDNLFVGRSNKLYCSENCKNSEKIKKRIDRDNIKELKVVEFINPINLQKNKFLNDKIEISISYRNVTHFLKLGYKAVINSPLQIFVLDLPTVSHIRINPICEVCGSINNIQFNKYIANKERNGLYSCKRCRVSKTEKIVNLPKSEDRYKEITRISFRRYKNEVRRLTKRNSKVLFDNWDGYDFYDNQYIKEFLSCIPHSDNYPSIDHKLSVYYGFVNNIQPEEIGKLSNLCITKRSINSTKRDLTEEDFKLQNN